MNSRNVRGISVLCLALAFGLGAYHFISLAHAAASYNMSTTQMNCVKQDGYVWVGSACVKYWGATQDPTSSTGAYTCNGCNGPPPPPAPAQPPAPAAPAATKATTVPCTSCLTVMSTTGAPGGHCNTNVSTSNMGVWTGSTFITWGGESGDVHTQYNDGGIYDPASDSWTALPTAGAPSGRAESGAVWSPLTNEYIVWGGENWNGSATIVLSDGGAYSVTNNTWRTLSTANAPSARYAFTPVWLGNEMLVWGGWNGSAFVNTGKRYNPVTNGWGNVNISTQPSARDWPAVIAVGSMVYIVGGNTAGGSTNTTYSYNSTTDVWTALPNLNTSRYAGQLVWTGSSINKLIAVMGFSSTGNAPVNSLEALNLSSPTSWSTLAPSGGPPTARYNFAATWADGIGSQGGIMIFGGYNASTAGFALQDTWTYDYAANKWTAGPTPANASWGGSYADIGSQMIYWGGCNNSGNTQIKAGAIYSP